MIEAAVSNPCDGLSIAQVFPPEVVAGDSFLVLGCGFGSHPVALVDAAIGRLLAIDYWSENVIQARHPGGAATAQLRVITGSGDATEPFPVTITGVPMYGMFHVGASRVDGISGAFFYWQDSGADEYSVELRALGAVPPRIGVFTEVARLSRSATPDAFDPDSIWMPHQRYGSYPPSEPVWWNPQELEDLYRKQGSGARFACRVRALANGRPVSPYSNYVVGRWLPNRDDEYFEVETGRTWSDMVEFKDP